MTDSDVIENFKEVCRQEFKGVANRISLKEVVSPKRKNDNLSFLHSSVTKKDGFPLKYTKGKSRTVKCANLTSTLVNVYLKHSRIHYR
ncbi:hypothetical protein N483_09145 [Pseudoalteromonas luteoviolacea NCIMB 1944]|uniref:Uncharacterized protein n=1 Tax=Pseudoalteromonas luteoviolacea (strain 2ta16) TaxID=1353533 RepID=V4HV30_PSEL2|nr:hypothetical protein PL2TA16_00685 [Pseudoalteromonas luteoviolacea 2ta16]KZN43451.1 hypothetical protein N483_09145 [Pseudoalteromonas luteoviolacea NCIMB 1944]